MKLRGASAVSVGILGSRILGFVRESIFAHYFGNTDAADAFKGALRIPNLLQNLFGEGVLSASFIPVYARLRGEGKEEEAKEVARSVLFILTLFSSVITILGILTAPLLIDLITPGFEGAKRELAIQIVQILFPGTALLVISAWCLGIQNSHKRFLLSYAAPMFWNLAIIVALLLFGSEPDGILFVTWGVVAGSLLQLLVQIPTTLKLLNGFRGQLKHRSEHVRRVLKNFLPVLLSRGVVQISAFVDSMIASLLRAGSLSALGYAQTLYLLPVSLFGMAVSAAQLPELSETRGEAVVEVSNRLQRAISRMLFFVFPSAAAFICIGDRLVAFVFQSGEFSSEDTRRVWEALSLLAIALPFGTISRLFSSYFYSRDLASKLLWVSISRVILAGALGFYLSRTLDLAGLCLGASIGSYFEFLSLSVLLTKQGIPLPKFSRSTLIFGGWSLICGMLARVSSAGFDRLEGGLIAVVAFSALYLIPAIILRKRVG